MRENEHTGHSVDSNVKAMISLLDDEDESIFSTVSLHLTKIVSSDRPEAAEIMRLMVEKKNETAHPLSARIEELIDNIQYDKLAPRFRQALLDTASLEDLTFLIAKIGYPGIDAGKYKRELDRLESEIRSEFFRAPITEVNQVFMLSVVLYDREGYSGNSSNYYDPDNSFINCVMERKLGIPITLGGLYLILAERVGLPIYGVNMPAHFMLKYERDNHELFIDPFNKGRILEKQDCIRFLMNSGYGYVEQYLTRASNMEICERMLNNLRNSYNESGNRSKLRLIERYLDILRLIRGEEASENLDISDEFEQDPPEEDPDY
ncbi:MAG: hypothetical protein HGB19_02685 [Chlorobiales bacterium]|nr:hypothetical protein [Chlorobiales bacterium]